MSKKMAQNILFLGCGKMGSILANNLVNEGGVLSKQITILKKTDKNKISEFNYVKSSANLAKNYRADLVFLCIKPQDAEEVLTNFSKAKIFHKDTIFISILAGKKIAFFQKIFGKDAKIIRSMPNLPIQDSQGIFAYRASKNITKTELSNLAKNFDKFGSIIQLKDESLFDVVTAIFGSGPAYIFLLQEIFTEIAISNGINKENAADLIETLFLGSALMSCNSKMDFKNLRKSVTSKGGTTESALEILQKKSALKNLFKNAINAAIKKSQKL
jgi:pyrroline-5-carboxylate reductase